MCSQSQADQTHVQTENFTTIVLIFFDQSRHKETFSELVVHEKKGLYINDTENRGQRITLANGEQDIDRISEKIQEEAGCSPLMQHRNPIAFITLTT